MKISAIKQQVKRSNRYSIFVDGKYAFSLSESALLDAKLASGQELNKGQLEEYKKLSSDDKLYSQALRYIAMRPRTEWEIRFYLERKKAPPPLVDSILNKLSIIGLIDDVKYAKAFVNDRRLLRPTSRRKMMAELRKKRVADDVIEQALGQDNKLDQASIREIVDRKRRQAKYRDDNLKLMQYLARQGFSYDDIKTALSDEP